MSNVGSSVELSMIGTLQAQHSASRARDKERNDARGAPRPGDSVELRIHGVEHPDAVRQLPSNDSEQAEDEHHRRDPSHAPAHRTNDDDRPHVDLRA